MQARRSPVFWPQPKKLDVLEGLVELQDCGMSRSRYARSKGISRRTLQRWIHQFNNGGLADALEPTLHRPGRRKKIGLLDFRERILPATRIELSQSGRPDTIKNLHNAAQSLGLVDTSYSTFRRTLKLTNSDYKRRRVVPTLEEYLFHEQTGRWPARFKARARRKARQEAVMLQKIRDEFLRERERCKAEAKCRDEASANVIAVLPPS